jgi:hypothetical protein
LVGPDLAQRLPDAMLERSAANIERQIESGFDGNFDVVSGKRAGIIAERFERPVRAFGRRGIDAHPVVSVFLTNYEWGCSLQAPTRLPLCLSVMVMFLPPIFMSNTPEKWSGQS